jgi:hypothetical protein
MLQRMCEGHYSVLQNYLREQPDNINKIDLVELAVEVLQTVAEGLDDKTLPLVNQVLHDIRLPIIR